MNFRHIRDGLEVKFSRGIMQEWSLTFFEQLLFTAEP